MKDKVTFETYGTENFWLELRQEIENSALEQAAKVCDEIMKDNKFTPPFVCAAAIRALKERGK